MTRRFFYHQLDFIEKCVKATDDGYFTYLCRKFPHLLEAQQKEEIFVKLDIRKLIFDSNFEAKERMQTKRRLEVVTLFLGNVKDPILLT